MYPLNIASGKWAESLADRSRLGEIIVGTDGSGKFDEKGVMRFGAGVWAKDPRLQIAERVLRVESVYGAEVRAIEHFVAAAPAEEKFLLMVDNMTAIGGWETWVVKHDQRRDAEEGTWKRIARMAEAKWGESPPVRVRHIYSHLDEKLAEKEGETKKQKRFREKVARAIELAVGGRGMLVGAEKR